MDPPLPYELIGFGIGLLFGSFLNVCISRLPLHESVAAPRSHCPACGHAIRWYDNVPVLSWIVLRARCRDCKASIVWRYPAVELAVGLWAIWPARMVLFGYLAYAQLGRSPVDVWLEALSLFILGFLLIGLLVMDWQTHRLPDAFTLTGSFAALFLVCVQAIFLAPGEGQILLENQHIQLRSPGSGSYEGNVFLTGPETLIFGRIAAAAAAALLLLGVRRAYKALRKRDGMGLGDVKMFAMIAAFLGLSQSLFALLIGVVTASLYGILLLARGRAHSATRLPFGSFLAIGGLAAALFGQAAIDWYASLLR